MPWSRHSIVACNGTWIQTATKFLFSGSYSCVRCFIYHWASNTFSLIWLSCCWWWMILLAGTATPGTWRILIYHKPAHVYQVDTCVKVLGTGGIWPWPHGLVVSTGWQWTELLQIAEGIGSANKMIKCKQLESRVKTLRTVALWIHPTGVTPGRGHIQKWPHRDADTSKCDKIRMWTHWIVATFGCEHNGTYSFQPYTLLIQAARKTSFRYHAITFSLLKASNCCHLKTWWLIDIFRTIWHVYFSQGYQCACIPSWIVPIVFKLNLALSINGNLFKPSSYGDSN